MLQGLLFLLGQMEPIWVIMTVVIGMALGYLSGDLEFEWKTIYLLCFFYFPFAIARLIAFIIAGVPAVAGTGTIGILFFTLYLIVFLIGRKIAHR